MKLKDFTRPTKVTYKELCDFFHINTIEGSSKKDIRARQYQLEEMRSQYSGNIKYNEKKRTYIIIPNQTKLDIKKEQLKLKAKENNTLIQLNSGKEINAIAKNAITQTGFRDYILYMASHFHGDSKAQFYLMCLHPLAFYNRIFNNYYINDEIDGFIYLANQTKYTPDILIAGRDLIFKRLGSYISTAIEHWEKQGYLDIFEYYVTNEGHKLELSMVRKYTQKALKELNISSENIALEICKEEFLDTRDKYFQEDIKQGKIDIFKPTQSYLQITERKFQIFTSAQVRQITVDYTQEYLLSILNDFCKVVQARLLYNFKNQKIVIPQEKKKHLKVGYKFETLLCECYSPYLILDSESFIMPDVFQELNCYDNYSIYIMKVVGDKIKVSKIIHYRRTLKQQPNNKGKA